MTAMEVAAGDRGPEYEMLAARVGLWEVTETVRESPNVEPSSTTLRAAREMIGPFLRESIEPLPGVDQPAFQRMYLLGFHRLESRWKYVSLDTRNPVDPFAIANPEGSPLMLRMEETITFHGLDRDHAEERFLVADGTATLWAAYTYDYVRRS